MSDPNYAAAMFQQNQIFYQNMAMGGGLPFDPNQ
jgi:hypothetical protein